MPEIQYGVAVQVSAHVWRVTATNSGRMTGPGTNSYIVGERQLALIDPGPAIPAHIDALERICAGRLRWILVTHTHRDHSPAAHELAARTARLRLRHGRVFEPAHRGGDTRFDRLSLYCREPAARP